VGRLGKAVARIVVFDSVIDSSLLLKRLLEGAGHDVTLCSTRDGLLLTVNADTPDLLVARVRRSFREGASAAQLFREVKDRLKILVITDHFPDRLESSLGADVLIDPGDIDRIESKVTELLSAAR